MKSRERNLSLAELSPAATAISAAGFGLVLKGCSEINTTRGVVEIAVGRGLDGVDGTVARLLDQESDAGALVDAGLDKFGILAVSIAAWKTQAIPRPVIATVVAKNALSAGLTYVHGKRHPNESFRPTNWGKASMATDSVAYGAYLEANALEHEHPEKIEEQKVARQIGRTAVTAGLVSGAVSLAQYTKRALGK
ncbi:MAG TPA: CDP-alcohol phosphatidyltransferase family protein [Candidatus Saccharimonadales bacterium]|nr:CDP-alcohol phosphatidyltransferase family protein [Candidatus Saccharimonadales bacterium]